MRGHHWKDPGITLQTSLTLADLAATERLAQAIGQGAVKGIEAGALGRDGAERGSADIGCHGGRSSTDDASVSSIAPRAAIH